MSVMKCPICGQELKNINSIWFCESDGCIAYDCMEEDIWKELIRTRKALDRAKWWLQEIVENHRYTPISTAEMALKEITALEQKESK